MYSEVLLSKALCGLVQPLTAREGCSKQTDHYVQRHGVSVEQGAVTSAADSPVGTWTSWEPAEACRLPARQGPGALCALAHACAKLIQSCPTLCAPMDCSPPGFSVHGILQARTLEWVAISFSNACISREAKDSALLSNRDAGLLEPPERTHGRPASSSVWREDTGLLSRPS